MNEPLHGIWTAICDNVRIRIGNDAFQRWFAPTDLLGASEEALTIGVPNEIQQFWIESNYLLTLQNAVIAVLGARRDLRFALFVVEKGGGSRTGNLTPANALESVNGHAEIGMQPSVHPRLNGAEAVAVVDVAGKPSAVTGLSPRYLFENFVVGASNQFAQAAARAVAENPARIYNPLFIHGGTGLGKTHLMQAIGHHVVQHRKKAKVVYVTSEQFTNEFIDAIQTGGLVKFRKRYRQADVLLIDDVQFFAGKERSQEEFFHTFNSLFDGHKQVVLTSDCPPSETPRLEARLVSRFEWGIAAQLQPPDVETRTAILRKKMLLWQVQIPDEIVRFLAERIANNVRRLEGSLMRVASFASMGQGVLTVQSVEELLRDLLQEDALHVVTIDKIQRVVAEHFDVRLADMTSKRRPACIAFPRQIAMALARELTRSSFSEIGAAFGGRDHGTVMHACKLVNSRMANDPQLRSIIRMLESKVKGS